jgi:hypothetical protein
MDRMPVRIGPLLRRVAAGAAMGILLGACSSGANAAGPPTSAMSPTGSTPVETSPPAPTPTGLQVTPGASGWTVYTDAADGFALQAPAWMNDVTQQAAAQNPLVRTAVGSPFLSSTLIQVLVVPLDAGTTLDTFASTTASRLSQFPGFAGVTGREHTSLGGAPAERFDWSASSNGSKLIEREYLVVRNGRGYVLSIDTTPTPRQADFEMFAKVAARFGFSG